MQAGNDVSPHLRSGMGQPRQRLPIMMTSGDGLLDSLLTSTPPHALVSEGKRESVQTRKCRGDEWTI